MVPDGCHVVFGSDVETVPRFTLNVGGIPTTSKKLALLLNASTWPLFDYFLTSYCARGLLTSTQPPA